MSEWNDILSAPLDGRRIIAWAKEWTGPCTAQYYGARGWGLDSDLPAFLYQPTHWLPLPAPPQSPAKEG